MKKKKIKPFSVEEWRSGANVETRDGRSVRIFCTDLKDNYPIIAAVMCNNNHEVPILYDTNGSYCVEEGEKDCDLVIVEEVEEPEPWAEDKGETGMGWYIDDFSCIHYSTFYLNDWQNFRAFATKKQAKSALAMARISQLMAHDERYGGVVTDEEWQDDYTKYCIGRHGNRLWRFTEINLNFFLAFHTEEQCDLFLAENERLVKDYLMID